MQIPNRVQASANDVHAPVANTAAIVTYPSIVGDRHVITGLCFSYDAAPTGGNVKVEDGSGVTVFSIDITSAGAGFFPFAVPKSGSASTALIITLAAAGAGVKGKLSIPDHWVEP